MTCKSFRFGLWAKCRLSRGRRLLEQITVQSLGDQVQLSALLQAAFKWLCGVHLEHRYSKSHTWVSEVGLLSSFYHSWQISKCQLKPQLLVL